MNKEKLDWFVDRYQREFFTNSSLTDILKRKDCFRVLQLGKKKKKKTIENRSVAKDRP